MNFMSLSNAEVHKNNGFDRLFRQMMKKNPASVSEAGSYSAGFSVFFWVFLIPAVSSQGRDIPFP